MNHIANLLEDINTDDFFSSHGSVTASDGLAPQPTSLSFGDADDSIHNVICDEHVHEAPEAAPSLDITAIRHQLIEMQGTLSRLLALIDGTAATYTPPLPHEGSAPHTYGHDTTLEGVFDGQHMIGQDGNEYQVPPNYASKSKLVEGDLMKLTITPAGQYRFKQIGPIARKHIVGELIYDAAARQWSVIADGRLYKILTASATFHKGTPGGRVSIIVPEDGESDWAAIDHKM